MPTQPTFTPQLDEECYRFVEDETQTESTIAAYGEPSIVMIGKAVYYLLIEDPNADVPSVIRVDAGTAMHTNEAEDVEGLDDEDDDEEEDEDEPAELVLPGGGEEEEDDA